VSIKPVAKNKWVTKKNLSQRLKGNQQSGQGKTGSSRREEKTRSSGLAYKTYVENGEEWVKGAGEAGLCIGKF